MVYVHKLNSTLLNVNIHKIIIAACTCMLINRYIKSPPPVYISSHISDSLWNFVSSKFFQPWFPAAGVLQHHFYFSRRHFVSYMALGFCTLKMLTVFHFRLTAETWGIQIMLKTKHWLGRWRETAWTCAPCACDSVSTLWVNDGSLLSTTSSPFLLVVPFFGNQSLKSAELWWRAGLLGTWRDIEGVLSHCFSESLFI